MKTKVFFGLISALLLGLFCQTASAQESRSPGALRWGDYYDIYIYVDQQNPAQLWLETRGGKYSCDINVTIDYEVKPVGEPSSDGHDKVIRHFTVTLRAGQTSATKQCNDILYYPCHNGMPVVTPGTCNGQPITAGFDIDKKYPTFSLVDYPDYQ